ncbi:MAG: archease [Pseudomonadota bacterium]
MSTGERYRTISHTADIGIEAFGTTIPELFENAAWGFVDLLTDAEAILPKERRTIRLNAENKEDLLVRWLSELLFLFETERKLFARTTVTRLTETDLEAVVEGESFDSTRYEIRHEIKAVTYHALSIGPTADGWRAQVIFDL